MVRLTDRSVASQLCIFEIWGTRQDPGKASQLLKVGCKLTLNKAMKLGTIVAARGAC